METPGQKIEALRIARALTQEEACVLTEGQVSQSAWSSIECGDTTWPRAKTQGAIAWALNVEPRDIWSPRQRPLRQEEEDDPSWPSVMERVLRVEREGSLEERQHAGKWLLEKIERADPTLREPSPEWGRFPILLRLALSLTTDPETYRPITITDGETVGQEINGFTPVTRGRVEAAKRRRVQAQKGRVKAQAPATAIDDPPVSKRPRTRERRDSPRTSRGSPSSDDPDGKSEPALGRTNDRQGG